MSEVLTGDLSALTETFMVRLRQDHELFVTREEALRIIHHLAEANEPGIVRVSGRELITGLPRKLKVDVSRWDLGPPDAPVPVCPVKPNDNPPLTGFAELSA